MRRFFPAAVMFALAQVHLWLAAWFAANNMTTFYGASGIMSLSYVGVTLVGLFYAAETK